MSLNTISINDRLGPGGLENVAILNTDANGNTVLVGADGNIPFNLKPLTVELANINNVGARPSGADWLFSAAQDLDKFTGYLQFEPTIFFDPNDTGSLNYGTEEEPYNTVSDVNRRMVGNQAGAVLGIKRGSHLYVHGAVDGAGLLLTCYGTAASPVLVVPYGDPTQPMPIIDGGEVTGDGTSYPWVAHNANVWKIASAVTNDTDVFENDVRCLKKDVLPSVAGECQYAAGVLYYWPRSTTNPNDGSVKIPWTQFPVKLEHPDVAAEVGNVKFIGLDVRYGRGNNIFSGPGATASNITGIGATDVLFCRSSHNGFDDTNPSDVITGSVTAIDIYGAHATLRVGGSETISSRVIGNEVWDCPHHAFEFGAHDNALIEHNYVHGIWGSLLELYHDCSGMVCRNNFMDGAIGYGHLYSGGSQGGCAFLYNFTKATHGGSVVYDNSHALNVGNIVYNNYFKNFSQVGVICNGGGGAGAATPHKIYNNTFDVDHDAIFPLDGTSATSAKPVGLNTKRDQTGLPAGTTFAANGFMVWSNNLFYSRYSPLCKAGVGYTNSPAITIDAPNSQTPTGNYNCYFSQTGVSVAPFIYGGTSTANFTTYKAAVAAYSLDVNSRCAYGTVHPVYGAPYGNSGGGNTTIEQLAYTESSGKLATGSVLIQGGASVNANRLTDYIGQTVVDVATPAIGCYER